MFVLFFTRPPIDSILINRVMGAVQRAVFRLQEPEKLHAFLSELGRKHEKNGAKLEYIDVSSIYHHHHFYPILSLSGSHFYVINHLLV